MSVPFTIKDVVTTPGVSQQLARSILVEKQLYLQVSGHDPGGDTFGTYTVRGRVVRIVDVAGGFAVQPDSTLKRYGQPLWIRLTDMERMNDDATWHPYFDPLHGDQVAIKDGDILYAGVHPSFHECVAWVVKGTAFVLYRKR